MGPVGTAVVLANQWKASPPRKTPDALRLLLVAPFPFGPGVGHGGGTAGWSMVKALSQDHDVHVLCLTRDTPEDLTGIAAMSELCAVTPVHHNPTLPSLAWRRILGFMTRTPQPATYSRSSRLRKGLNNLVQEMRPDVVILQFPQMAQYASTVAGVPTVQDVHDAFSVSWLRRAHARTGRASRRALRQSRYWDRYERKWYPQAAQCWSLSAEDRAALLSASPQSNVVLVGLPLMERLPPLLVERGSGIGMVASFDHEPNLEALELLVLEIAPAVAEADPSVHFLVAGRGAPAALTDRLPGNVEYLGFVDSVADFYERCEVVVAPMVSGAGIKIKVAEALIHRCAVVATQIGAEGLGMVDGLHGRIVDSISAFPAAIIELSRDATLRTRLAAEGGSLASARFDAGKWRAQASTLLEAARTGTSTGPP